MNFKKYLSGYRMAIACALLAAATWIVAPHPDAFGTGAWTYPENSASRMQNIQALNGALANLSNAHMQQQQRMQMAQKALVDLEAELAAAQKTLLVEERPVAEAINKYRKAQEASLIDPMISTETQRLEVVKVKEANESVVSKRKAQIEMLTNKVPQVRGEIANAQQEITAILQQIDGIIKQRDEVSEQVFLKSVAN
ncbi:MAG: hypothetical protein HQL77_14610 [Magnetococcales bacterium]|nr:hypothetical protein [Magnetococcales bacterium]MBF0436591.1 hypothetical protein [Magnetococcales bacterium]